MDTEKLQLVETLCSYTVILEKKPFRVIYQIPHVHRQSRERGALAMQKPAEDNSLHIRRYRGNLQAGSQENKFNLDPQK